MTQSRNASITLTFVFISVTVTTELIYPILNTNTTGHINVRGYCQILNTGSLCMHEGYEITSLFSLE